MTNEQIQYAYRLLSEPIFTIQGKRVVWHIIGSGVSIDCSFVLTWLEKYAERQANNRDELPAQTDYDGIPNRELLREYNNAITQGLIRMGVVRQASSAYAPRWIVGEDERYGALDILGVWVAEAWAKAGLEDAEYREEIDDD